MSKVLLLQLHGKMPNIAMMRISAHHKERGDTVDFRYAPRCGDVERKLWDDHDLVYASLIFERTRPIAERLLAVRPDAVLGGTGWDLTTTLEAHGIAGTTQDYSIYPSCQASIDFLTRGCRLRCGFCVVPRKEGAVREEKTVAEVWRGDPWPRDLILLDNDLFGNPSWRERIAEIRDGNFRVSFNQGINVRMLNDETAAVIASVDYRDDSFTRKRIYTAWDNAKDERRLFDGLAALTRHGVKPDHIMVYMLTGYWPGETHEERDARRAKLHAFGVRPYPMPFVRNDPSHNRRRRACHCEPCARGRELVGFQKWVIGAYDKRITRRDWEAAGYEPRRLGAPENKGSLWVPRVNPTEQSGRALDSVAANSSTAPAPQKREEA